MYTAAAVAVDLTPRVRNGPPAQWGPGGYKVSTGRWDVGRCMDFSPKIRHNRCTSKYLKKMGVPQDQYPIPDQYAPPFGKCLFRPKGYSMPAMGGGARITRDVDVGEYIKRGGTVKGVKHVYHTHHH